MKTSNQLLNLNTTEIFSIYKARMLCASSSTLCDKEITVVSDSMVAISWVNDKAGFGSLGNIDIIYDIGKKNKNPL